MRTKTESETISYRLPGEAVFPEGVSYQPSTGKFFVGSAANGTVFRGDVESGEVEVFSQAGNDGRYAALGTKVDGQGRLYVAGGVTGHVYVYETETGELLASPGNGKGPEATLLNDLVIGPNGAAYITDSFDPVLYKLAPDLGELEPWLDMRETVVDYKRGINFNGIVATEDGRYVIPVQFNTGKLFRVDTRTRELTEIDLGHTDVWATDGMLLFGETLYASRLFQGRITTVRLSDDFSRGDPGFEFTDPSLRMPTTMARAGDRLLVVNSQFDQRGGPEGREGSPPPELPFTVSNIPIPVPVPGA